MLRVTLPFRIANITLQHYFIPGALAPLFIHTLHQPLLLTNQLIFHFGAMGLG